MMMKEHIVDTLRRDRVHRWATAARAARSSRTPSCRSSRACSTASSRAATTPTRSRPAWRSSTACCSSTPTSSPEWNALMGGLTQAQINAKKTAINGHLDHLGCQSWNNAFGFNNKPGNYVPRPGRQPDHRRARAGRRAAQQLPAAGRAGLRPGHQPDRHALRRRRTWRPPCGAPPRASPPAAFAPARPATTSASQYGLKALRSGAITPEEFVTLNERVGGLDADSNRMRGAHDGRPAGPRHRLPRRHRGERHEPRQGRRSSTRAAGTSRASTTSGARSPNGRASTRPTAATTATRSSGATAPVCSPRRRPRSRR